MSPLLTLSALTAKQQHGVRSYRTAAAAIDAIARPYYSYALNVRALRAGLPDEADLIPPDQFRSLALALRLVYQPTEDAHFEKIVAILEIVSEDWIPELCSTLRADWVRAVSGPGVLQVDGVTYNPGQMLSTWLYAVAFHQDEKKQSDADRLEKGDPFASWMTQMAVRSLCIHVRNLDSALAHVLDEPPLPPPDGTEPQRESYLFRGR
jgi:hypothetical protein